MIPWRLGVLALLALLWGGCSSPGNAKPDGGSEDAPEIPDADEGPIEIDGGPCKTTFRFTPPLGQTAQTVSVTGEWSQFANPGVALTGPDAKGAYEASIELAPAFVGYKLIVDGSWQLDPAARFRKWVGGVENSGVRITDCKLPVLSLESQQISAGQFTARVKYAMGQNQSRIDSASLKARVEHDHTTLPATAQIDPSGAMDIHLMSLAGGKYTLFVDAKDRAGRAAKTLRITFWIEPETFDWRDALIYMGVTDRMKNGDVGNDAPKVPNVDDRANFQNGDLLGMQQIIASGYLDALGVRALWLTPFQTNAGGSYISDDGMHLVTSYHGYWPTKAREVEPRLGGNAALDALVKEAHAHGIRVLMDYVANHVHEKHDYFLQHPEWFRTGCICGTNNCDWTSHRLDCLFASYMPDVNWTNNDASEQLIDDALFWIDRFDLDGLRIDAVKHIEDSAIINLSGRIRDEFGSQIFLMGETAMGWSDCGLACNKDQYDTISRYVGPMGLNGQFDFVLYHAVPYRTFAHDEKGMLHADYWAQASTWMYPNGSIMTPYIGSHDTPRSVTLATYRNQNGYPDWLPGNKWSNVAGPPPDAEPYARHRAAYAWMMGLPGAPLLYYGDEYGEWGGADPNNRALWRGDKSLSSEEAATLALAKKLGAARKELSALRRGDYRSVYATDEVLLFARGGGALVAVSKSPSLRTFTATLPLTLALMKNQMLHDRLGGSDVAVDANGALTITLGPRGSAILAP